jgi:primosomal protein N' (replication factor Y)
VVADDVTPETERERLRPLAAAVSAGPPSEMVDLCRWIAWRWCGPVVATLRSASPPNVVEPGPSPVPDVAVHPVAPPPSGLDAVVDAAVGLVAWPPAADRRDLVRSLLAPAGSTIVVVPEGVRLASLVGALARDGRPVVVIRGDQTSAERTRAWTAARHGACVVVGGRVAVLAPVPDLAAIVLLDEGDEGLQEERAPTWHARDVAIERARRIGVRVTLVSPAPTVDACAAATAFVRPNRAVERDGWPRLDVVDLRDERPGFGALSELLATRLHEAIDHGTRALCVVNRKGRARLLACAACGELVRCERCGAAVVETETGLTCPRCDEPRARICSSCGGTRLRVVRAGVARLRDDLAALLPRATVAEVDASTDEIPDADVLVGTEAVLHRVRAMPGRRPGLAAFLELDQELLALRYRAAEQALWLLARAARVVGPDGLLLVQTRAPEHEVVRAVRARDPELVPGVERERRQLLGFPPFGALAELSGATESVDAAVARLHGAGVTVLGPTATRTGARALARADDVATLCDALAGAAAEGRRHGRLRVHVDPPRV